MEKLVKLNDRTFRIYKSEKEIIEAIRAVADKINDDYLGKRPIIVPILNGSFMFASDLMKELKLDCEISFVKASSYEGTSTTGVVSTLIGLNQSIEDRHVIILEDIVDSGHTLARILPAFHELKPASLRIASLLFKPKALKNPLTIDYVGMEIPNDFIVGYGLDYDGIGRNLRDIYQVVEE
ncbi:MAG: hypoxanthine phosphoribosyltransferase [Bacteroidetes bacterium]|nr:hypoxanthine phosphoribosyltransferase [Bacteroidota bacterium]